MFLFPNRKPRRLPGGFPKLYFGLKILYFFVKGSVLPLTCFVHHQQSIRCWWKVFKHNVLFHRNGNLRDHRWTTREFWFRNFETHWISKVLLFGLSLTLLSFYALQMSFFLKLVLSIWDRAHFILFNMISSNLLLLFIICTHRFSTWWFKLFLLKMLITN